MPEFISPGVYTLEQDLSQYVSNLSSTIVAMVGTSDIGPTETPTLVSSPTAYVNLFGQPSPNHYLGYAALSFLEQGAQLYVTRVAPSDAAFARLTVPVPASFTPYAGNWTLTSNTATSATFTVTNKTGATGADQLIVMPDDGTVTLSTPTSGFDFTDTTNAAAINPTGAIKLGADLASFAVNTDTVDEYIKGRSFSVTTGYGKGSSVPVTDMVFSTDLDLTVDASKFNSFNSPILATGTGSITCVADATFNPASSTAAIVIGKANLGGANEGTISLQYTAGLSTVPVPTSGPDITSSGALALASLTTGQTGINPLIHFNGNNVLIDVPLYYHASGGITIEDAANNAILISATLNAIISAFTASIAATPVVLTGNLLTLSTTAGGMISYNGVVGLGSVNSVTKASAGLKSATASSSVVTLSAATLGASANFTLSVSGTATAFTVAKMQITGTFELNLSRPMWIMSQAGASYVPTLLKFTSLGESDFSNVAITVDINKDNMTSTDEQEYLVSVYARTVGLTISTTSVYQSDFALVESYLGTIDALQSKINKDSAYVSLKVDYTTTDHVNYETGEITNIATTLVPSDQLRPSFGLFADPGGLGALSGASNTVETNVLYPSYSAFLMGGSAGTTVDKYSIMGNAALKTGVWSVSDPESIDINLLVAPGWSADPAVAAEMIKICTSRSDCMCILDTPFGLSVQDVKNYRNNVLNTGSNYAAIYYPWVQIADSVNKINLFVPPSGLVAAQYAYNDANGAVFTAPAGRNRGNIISALATERTLNQVDRDELTRANINPIYTEAGYGIYIRGQMTMQRASTALNRVNVRRLLLYLRKIISTASKYFEFEPGDAVTALRLQQLATTTLKQYQNLGAIRSFTVDVGPDVNTAQVLENNELNMVISLVPTKTAEIIVETFRILPQGQGITINNA